MKKFATALVVLGLAFGSLSAANTVWNTGKYRDFDNRMQVLSVPGAKALKVTIKGATECGYDYIYIYDSCGKLVAKLSGNINKTVYVKGDSIIAKLRADDSYTDKGVVVTVCPTDKTPVVTTTAYEDSCGCSIADPDRDPSAGPVGPDPDTDPSIRGMTPDPDVDPSLR
ncbi:MAG: hypothetical protein GXO31_05775 [Epsilonproteobacteria bacterium]|nr:hypothetical protein [Campylobacterota bacterium]